MENSFPLFPLWKRGMKGDFMAFQKAKLLRNETSAGYGDKGNKHRRIDRVALALPFFFLDSRITVKLGSVAQIPPVS